MTQKPAEHAVGICQRTGFKVKASELVQEWTGLWVSKAHFDPKHPVYDMPAPRGERVRDNATGPGQDNDTGDSLENVPDISELGANN